MKARVVAVLLASLASVGWADCPRPEGSGGVAAGSDAARLAFLSAQLDAEAAAASRWTLGWGATYGVLTVAQLGVMGLFPREEQPDWYWGAVSSVVGVAFTVLDPLEVMEAGPRFARRAATVSASDRCALLAEGEALLKASAEHEVAGRAWWLHAGNVLLGAGMGLILGLGYGRWTSALINGLINVAVGEATLFTQPNQLISAWEHYRHGDPRPSALRLHVVPTAGPGVGVVLVF